MMKQNTKFKPTEIVEIPEDWGLVTLGNISKSISETFQFTDEQVVFLNTSDIYEGKVLHSDKSNPKTLPGQAKKKIKKNDILFSEIRPANRRYAFIDFETPQHVVSTKLMVLRALPKILPQYLYTYLTSPKTLTDFQILAESRSGTFPQITFQEISGYPVALPSLAEQQQIVDFLFSINQKIEINKQMNKTLEEIGKALFKRWFVDFEFPNDEGKPYKSSGGVMVDSELGEIPVGWKIVEINDFGKIVCGKTPPKSNHEYFGGNIPFIKIPDMHGRMFVIKTEDTLTSDGANYQKNKTLPKRSICVSCIATVGLVCITTQDSQTNQQINSIIPNKSHHTEYLYFVLSSRTKQLQDFASGGSATLNLNTGNFSNIPMLSPGYELLAKFHSAVESVFEQIMLNAIEDERLSAIRDSLLPRLMSGKLRVN